MSTRTPSLMVLTLIIFNLLAPLTTFGNVGNVWEGRGIWVWAWQFKSEEELAKAFANISSLNFNMIYFLVKDSGNIYYNSSIRPIRSGYEWDPLKVAVNEAHKLGLEIHAWFVVFYDSWLVSKRPDLAAVDIKGNSSPNWTCPAKAEVRQYNLDLILEIVRNYDVDGIHLDYIRYENQSFCYCDYCKSEFKKETGLDPMPTSPAWIEWRAEQITSFVQNVSATVKSVTPHIKVSAAVLKVLKSARENNGQDWGQWVEKRIVDFLAPMTYTNSGQKFQEYVSNIIGTVNWRIPIYCGISLYELRNVANPKASLLQQINLTRTLAAQGQAIFNWHWLTYNATLYQQFIEAIREAYAEKAIPPHKIDHTPPKIKIVSQEPKDNVQPHQNVTVKINVTDLESEIATVALYYTTDRGLNWKTSIANTSDSTSTRPAIYVALIPGMSPGTTIQYKIVALDRAGNLAIDDNNGQYYVYNVIPEFQNTILLAVAFLASTLLVTLILISARLKSVQKLPKARINNYGVVQKS
jgi:uncharacterized lipoprotein YddW (UPF0748 family)